MHYIIFTLKIVIISMAIWQVIPYIALTENYYLKLQYPMNKIKTKAKVKLNKLVSFP